MDTGKQMEGSKAMIDTDTLKTSYLFPENPWNESVFKEILSTQFVSDSLEVYDRQFKKHGHLTLQLHRALLASDTQRSFGHPKVELDSNSLERLLLSQQPSLCRLDGRQVCLDEVKAEKYIMACSLSLPDCWDSPARGLAIMSNELYARRQHDFELIIVAKFRDERFQPNFAEFFEPFHHSCIVIPLDDQLERFLNFHGLENNQAIVIDPKGNVLVRKNLSVLTHFGSAAFPFTHIPTLLAKHWRLVPYSLSWFLGFEPSHQVLRKIPGTDEPLLEERKCISEFQCKIVLLYLYCVGNKLAKLYKTVTSLREKGVEFEILTVYVDERNPLQFIEVFSNLVAQRGLSWWVVPFDSSMYPRLRPLYSNAGDQLIVFDPKIDGGDHHGLEIMSLYGEALFPFTKAHLVELAMRDLSDVTLNFLFEPITDLCKEGHDEKIRMVWDKSVLERKNVLVYFHWVWSDPTLILDPFVSWYESLEDEERDYEVVFVSLVPHQDDNDFKLRFPSPIWTVFHGEEMVHSKFVLDNFFLHLFNHAFSTIVAFGKDGRIRSLRAHKLISSSKAKVGTYPFNGYLPGEIFKILDDYCNEKRRQQSVRLSETR